MLITDTNFHEIISDSILKLGNVPLLGNLKQEDLYIGFESKVPQTEYIWLMVDDNPNSDTYFT